MRLLSTGLLGAFMLAQSAVVQSAVMQSAVAQTPAAVDATATLLNTTLVRNSISGTIASAIYDLEEKLAAANPAQREAVAQAMQRLKQRSRQYLATPDQAAAHLVRLYSDEQVAALARLVQGIGDGDRGPAVTFAAFALTLTVAGEFGNAYWPAEKAILTEQGLTELPRFAVHFAPKFPAAEQAFNDLQQARPVIDQLLARPAIRAPLEKYWSSFPAAAQPALHAANPGREAAIDAMLGRIAAQGQSFLSEDAGALQDHLAARYSQDELQAILAFVSAPVPKGQRAHQLVRRLLLTGLMRDLVTSLLDEAFATEQAWIKAHGIEVVAYARLLQGAEFGNE